MSNEQEILQKVQQSFKITFDVNPQHISIETSPTDVAGWDSVGHLSLASNLEQAFGISLDVDELMEMENVRGIVRIVEGKLFKKV